MWVLDMNLWQMEALERRIAAAERLRAADRQRDLRSGSSDDFGLENEHSPRSVCGQLTPGSPHSCAPGVLSLCAMLIAHSIMRCNRYQAQVLCRNVEASNFRY